VSAVEADLQALLRARLPLYEYMGLRVESASNGIDYELASVIRRADGEIVAEGKGSYAIRSVAKLKR